MYKDSDPNNDWGYIETDRFSVSKDLNDRFFVVDDFYNNPEELRDFALSQYYYDDSGFEGLRTRKQFFFEGVKEKFEDILRRKIMEKSPDTSKKLRMKSRMNIS